MLAFATSARAVCLSTTVTFDGLTYDRLFVREPNATDLRPAPPAMSDDDVCRLLMARICRVPLDVIRALTPADETRLLDLIEPTLRPLDRNCR